MAWDDTKVAEDDFLSNDWNNMVTDQKTRAKILTPEEGTGADCSGSDGDTGRIFTLSNTELTVQLLVFVEGRLEKPSDMTITHNASDSTVTFNRAIYDTDSIVIFPYA